MIRQIQNSFVGGELSPEIWGRQDIKRYFESAALLNNFTVQRAGGITKRMGTDLVDDITGITNWNSPTPAIAGVKCARFRYDRSNAYLLVFVDQKIYFYKDGTAVTQNGQPYYIASQYLAPDLSGLNIRQCGDTLFIVHAAYPPATLVCKDTTGTNWTLGVINFQITTPAPTWTGGGQINSTVNANIQTGVTCIGTSADFYTAPQGSGTPFQTYQYCVSAIVDGQEGLPNTPVIVYLKAPWQAGDQVLLTWNNVPNTQYYNVYKMTYGTFGLMASIDANQYAVTPASGAWSLPPWNYVSGSLNDRWTTTLATGFQNNNSISLQGSAIDTLAATATYNLQYNVFAVPSNAGFGGFPEMACILLTLPTRTLITQVSLALGANVLLSNGKTTAQGFGASGFTIWATNGTLSSNPAWTKLYISGTVDPTTIETGLTTYKWPTGTAYKYFLFQATGIASSLRVCLRAIQFLPSNTITDFTDINIAQDTSNAPTNAKNPWTDDTGYPTVVTMFEQRSVWAGMPSSVAEILFSAAGNLYSFNKSVPQKATDQIDAFMSITEPGAIKHIVPIRNTLIVLTESGEWVTTFDAASGLAFSTIRIDQHTYYGCNEVEPLRIANGFLFCHRDGRSVLEYQTQNYTLDNFMANDRSTLARHLTEGRKIVAMAYQLASDSLVWAVLSDGSMISMTYIPAEEIFAWTRHSTGNPSAPDKILDIIGTGALVQQQVNGVNQDTVTDEVYLLVQRGTQLFVERMRVNLSSDTPLVGQAVCMDACQRVDLHQPTTQLNPPCDLPDGWPCKVVDVTTGVAQTGTWAKGIVTVPNAVQYAIIGIPIVSNLQTLYPEHPQTPIQNVHKGVKTVILRERRSADGTVGPLGSWTDPVSTAEIPIIGAINGIPTIGNAAVVTPAPVGGTPDGTVTLQTGDARTPLKNSWGREGQLSITHATHWPFTLLQLIYNLDMGEPD